MRVITCIKSRSVSPGKDQVLDLDSVNKLLLKNKPRSWSINSRESTPEVFSQDFPRDALQHWKNLAIHNQARLDSLSQTEDHRRTINSVQYWETEARHLDQVYWKIIQTRHAQRSAKAREDAKRVTSGVSKPNGGTDGPVSSRLRRKSTSPQAPQKSTKNTVQAVRRADKSPRKTP
ncbi:hypothetical protein AYL99_01925 [Fonsecaea erecta]|uniref:Uncharacterized protein n=1 Tax=Fonsecaea erecta TaxID=1367422 RepID=A0A178ZSA4_9EURO|nr:hypothetical protein AYL99_01925 [Fonsecaea erecta]OAP62698.1 hypothetical protein AYL99_01925 [Fonsecaea erecta]